MSTEDNPRDRRPDAGGAEADYDGLDPAVDGSGIDNNDDTHSPDDEELTLLTEFIDHETGLIHVPRLCRHCGYILKGLKPTGTCPECSTPIAYSLRNELLRHADPEWLRKVVLGADLFIVYIVLSILISCMSFSAMQMAGASAILVIGSIVGIAVSALWCAAVHLFTVADPAAPAPARFLTAPLLARAGAWIGLGSALLTPLRSQLNTLDFLTLLQTVAAGTIGLIGLIALFICAYRLAMRIPHPRLMTQLRIVGCGLGILMGCSTIGFALLAMWMGAIMNAPPPNTAQAGGAPPFASIGLGLLMPVMCLGSIAMLVFSIWAIVLTFMLRAALAAQVRIAARTWAAEPDANSS